MDYKFLFIVTSAIIPFKVGSAHSPEERFLQTLDTIKSIKAKVPNALIWITESSSEKLPSMYSDKLIELSDYYVEYYDDEFIRGLYINLERIPERFAFGKSNLEARSLCKTLPAISSLQVNRVFKITGRYLLNDNFNIQDYETRFLENKYVFQVLKFENTLHNELYGIPSLVTTGLLSFDINLLTETIALYQKCFEFLDTMMTYTSGTDIEHAIYKFVDMSKVFQVSTLGLTRIHGPNGDIHNM